MSFINQLSIQVNIKLIIFISILNAFFKYILLILYFKKTHYNTIIWKVKYIFNCYLAGIFLNKYYCVWAWLAHFSWPATGLADFFLRPTVHSAYCTLYKNILFDGGGKITSCFPPHYLQYPHFLFNKENIKLDYKSGGKYAQSRRVFFML